MDGNFSDRLQDVIRLSREEALRLGHDYIGTEHLLLGIIREGQGVAVRILRNLDCDLMKLKKAKRREYRVFFVCCFLPSVTRFRKERALSVVISFRSSLPKVFTGK